MVDVTDSKSVACSVLPSRQPLDFSRVSGYTLFSGFPSSLLSSLLRGGPVKSAGVMELVDVADSKSADGDIMWVRVPPPAPPSETLGTSAFEAPGVSVFLWDLWLVCPVLSFVLPSVFSYTGLNSRSNGEDFCHFYRRIAFGR